MTLEWYNEIRKYVSYNIWDKLFIKNILLLTNSLIVLSSWVQEVSGKNFKDK